MTTEYMNQNDKCIACMKGKESGEGNIMVNGKVGRVRCDQLGE